MSERKLPYSIEAEQAVVGAILRGSMHPLDWCREFWPSVDVLFDARHKLIYEAALKLADTGAPVGLVSISEKLRERGEIEQVGGNAYLMEVEDKAAPDGVVEYYGKIVVEKFRLRYMLDCLRLGALQIYELGDGSAEKCLDGIEASVLAAGAVNRVGTAERISAPTGRVMSQLDDYQRGVGMVSGLRTGFSYLDKMIGGLHPGEMCVLAGRPSTGKTSMAANIIDYVAIHQKVPVGIFSLEMSNDDITLRMICARAGANFHQVRTGFMSLEEHQAMIQEARAVGVAPIWMDDTPALEILQMRSRARRLVQQFGVKLIVIDYLQLAQAEGESDVAVITSISQGTKRIARELQVPVLVLSQLNRESEKDRKRKPMLSDLRGSGSIEQDADLVMLLYRRMPEDHIQEEEQETTQMWNVNVYVAKQRNGPTGDAELIFDRKRMRFSDAYQGRGRREQPNEKVNV